MSYRTLKRILGETNFEVKCLVLFGFGLSVLAVLTFFLYWWQTSKLIEQQNRTSAKLLMAPMIMKAHWEWASKQETKFNTPIDVAPGNAVQPNEVAAPAASRSSVMEEIKGLYTELQPKDFRDYRFEISKPDPLADSSQRPSDPVGWIALQELRAGKDDYISIQRETGRYLHFVAVNATPTCIKCHYHQTQKGEGGELVAVKDGDLIGMAKIDLPLTSVEAAMHSTNAFVITSEIVKVVLALLAIYLVIRYVITKPVLHLKRVSDAIAKGNLDMRADIRTGDEFEELSHAFNRMLRHLVTVQEELQVVNKDLDAKVDELAHVNLQLYEMNNLKNEFLATMSHELRTPLNSILGFSDVLSDAPNLQDKQKRYVQNIQTSGKSLLALINDILDLAKIESGKMELHPVEFSIGDLIERQVGTMVPQAERRKIALNWSVDADLPALFQDAGKLQQVLTNLLSNAIKFTPEGGRVRVKAERREELKFVLIIEDNGIGIPLDEQERIFEKFRQGRGQAGQKDALTRSYEGTGLGLSIVKEISKLLGGEVQLQSEFGKGSTFAVVLPIKLDAVESDDSAASRLVGMNRFRSIDLPKRTAVGPTAPLGDSLPEAKPH